MKRKWRRWTLDRGRMKKKQENKLASSVVDWFPASLEASGLVKLTSSVAYLVFIIFYRQAHFKA